MTGLVYEISKKNRANPLFGPIMKDIDYGRYLTGKGWTKVDYPYGYESRYHAIDIQIWVEEHLGEFWKMGRTFYFRDAKDASTFLLKYT